MRGVLSIFSPERNGFERLPVLIEGVPGKYGRFEADNSGAGHNTLMRFDREMSERYTRVAPSFGFDPSYNNPDIDKVIFNDPATIVIWKDKTKTVVKCQEGDTYSPELGLAMCIAKKYLGNKGNFNEVFKKWLPEEKPETSPEPEISIEKMRNVIKEHCSIIERCSNCVLYGENPGLGQCYTNSTDEKIIENYHLIMKEKEEAKNEKV